MIASRHQLKLFKWKSLFSQTYQQIFGIEILCKCSIVLLYRIKETRIA